MIDEDLYSGYSKEKLRKEVWKPVLAAKEAWKACPKTHDEKNVWSRPPFYECQPYAGVFTERHLGILRDNGHKMIHKDEEERIQKAQRDAVLARLR